MRKILKWIMLCLAVILIFCAGAAARGLKLYIVMSGSMEPQIRAGSLIITDTMQKEPEPGKIITFITGGTRVTHRVRRISTDGKVITKGDSNLTEDHIPVSPENIEGTVIFSVPYAGVFIIMLRRPSAVCFTVFMVIVITVLKRLKERESE